MKQLCLFGFALLLLLQLSSCRSSQDQTPAKPVATSVTPEEEKENQEVNTSPTTQYKKSDLSILYIAQGDQKQRRMISGRVVPKHRTQIFAEVQGGIMPGGLSFKEGISFDKDDVLLEIDKREFTLGLEAQRSAFLNSLTGIMPDMKSDYPENYEVWLAYIQEYQFGASLPPLPKTLSDNEKYFVTSYQIYNQYYSIKAQEERLKKYTIRAPYAGTITQSSIDIGSLVTPGQQLGTIISRYSFELEAGVDIETAQRLKYGDKVTFVSNDIEGKWTGQVVRKNKIIDPTTQNVPIYFRLSGKGIQPGMYLEGQYKLKTYKDVTALPTSAIKRDGSVLLLEGDVIRSKKVETLEFLTDSVIVKGLKDGDAVIITHFEQPVEGKKVAF
ncbi:MAG: HlyD family efflux transporter periplasmic adaptor subunit [Bacteroidota bacterium]